MALVGLIALSALVIFVVANVKEVERFSLLLSRARPEWLALAVILQAGTYVCAGAVWNQVALSAKRRVPLGALARLSVEKLSIDQLVPAGGMSGNFVVFQAMRGLGLPDWLAAESLLVDILSRYISYAIVSLSALAVLWFYRDITPITLSAMAVFFAIVVFVLAVILWFLKHKDKKLPKWLLRLGAISQMQDAVKYVSSERVLSSKLLAEASILSTIIFSLDGATLWAAMRAIGAPTEMIAAFTAVVLASIAGTISFLPGGIGSFEAGSVAALTLFGVPLEAALTGTLLLRWFTLWLPLVPGLLLARRDVAIRM